MNVAILLVEDHPFFEQSVRAYVSDSQYRIVDWVRYGEEIQPAVERYRPDIVLMDLGLCRSATSSDRYPTLAAAAAIRKQQPTTRILIVSNDVDRETYEAALRAGAQGYVLKGEISIENRTLLDALDAVQQNCQYQSAEVRTRLAQSRILTPTQVLVLQTVVRMGRRGHKERAAALGMNYNTFRNHLKAVNQRLDVSDITSAVVKAIELRIIGAPRGCDPRLIVDAD